MSKYMAIAFLVLLLGTTLLAACAKEAPTVSAPAPDASTEKVDVPQKDAAAGAAAEIKEVGNTICPITNSKVGSMEKGAHVDYKGYRVGLCCNGCKEKFMKAPDENLKKALEKK